jgi:hypothetical protein
MKLIDSQLKPASTIAANGKKMVVGVAQWQAPPRNPAKAKKSAV